MKVRILRTNDREGMIAAAKNGCGELIFFNERDQPAVTVTHSFPQSRRYEKRNLTVLPQNVVKSLQKASVRWGFCEAQTPNGDIVVQIH
jgi:hypothetical protein